MAPASDDARAQTLLGAEQILQDKLDLCAYDRRSRCRGGRGPVFQNREGVNFDNALILLRSDGAADFDLLADVVEPVLARPLKLALFELVKRPAALFILDRKQRGIAVSDALRGLLYIFFCAIRHSFSGCFGPAVCATDYMAFELNRGLSGGNRRERQ